VVAVSLSSESVRDSDSFDSDSECQEPNFFVQCDNVECSEWRIINGLSSEEQDSLQQQSWYCRMHPDEKQRVCVKAVEESLRAAANSDPAAESKEASPTLPGAPLSSWALSNLKNSDGDALTGAWLQSKRPISQVLLDAVKFLRDTAIEGGHNCGFDIKVMRDNLESCGLLHLWKPEGHVDSLAMAKAVLPPRSLHAPTKIALAAIVLKISMAFPEERPHLCTSLFLNKNANLASLQRIICAKPKSAVAFDDASNSALLPNISKSQHSMRMMHARMRWHLGRC
jgi:hypothetical protein